MFYSVPHILNSTDDLSTDFKTADSFLKSNGNIVHSAASFRTCSCIAISQQPEPTCRINRDKKKPPLATAGILSSGHSL
ncbi:hypothetical protein, partial [Faecalibaculum rodentium]